MKKSASAVILLLIIVLASCGKGWQGYYNENLDKYISLPSAIQITVPDVTVSDTELEEYIGSLYQACAEYTVTDKAYENGMYALLNIYYGADGIEPDENFSVLSYEAENEPYKSIKAALGGKNAGDSFTVNVLIPENFKNSGAALQETSAAVTLTSLKEVSYPNPEGLLKDYLDGRISSEEFTGKAKKELTKQKTESAINDARQSAWNEYLTNSVLIKIPYEVYIEYYNALLLPYQTLAEKNEVTLDEYITDNCKMTLEEFESNLSEKAMSKTKESLVIYSTAIKNGISASGDEILDYAERLAGDSDGEFQSGADYIEYYGKERITQLLLTEKILDAFS